MPMPTLTDTGQRLYDACAPLFQNSMPGMSDADNGYVGAILCAAFATMMDDGAYVARDNVNVDGSGKSLPGHAVLFCVDTVAAKWLPWLSQFVGDSQAVSAETVAANQRTLIKTPVNWTRGRKSTIIAKAKLTLTGAQTVIYNERTGGNPWTLTIATYTSQTPDPNATAQAILSVMPAWLVPTIEVVTGGDYATLAASHSSYSLMEAAHTTYADIPTNPAA